VAEEGLSEWLESCAIITRHISALPAGDGTRPFGLNLDCAGDMNGCIDRDVPRHRKARIPLAVLDSQPSSSQVNGADRNPSGRRDDILKSIRGILPEICMRSAPP